MPRGRAGGDTGRLTALRYPQPRRLLWAARIVVVACLLLAALAAVAATALLSGGPVADGDAAAGTTAIDPLLEALALALVAGFATAILGYAVIGYPLRCAACGRRILAETAGPKEPSSRAVSGLNGWVGTVVDVLRRRSFRCPACGVEQALGAEGG